MAQQTKNDYEGTFNSVTVGLFRNNTAGDIGADDARTLVENTADSVPFTLDDSYTWPFPQVTASGTDTYTATLSPPITAYVAGQKFQILFTNANTGAATLNLNAVGALAITKNGATALVAGDIPAGSIKILAYDGTRLQIIGNIGGGGSVTSVSGTTDRITSTGGTTPVIDIAAAYDAIVAAKAPLASPALTGTPTVPTAAQYTSTTQAASTAFVQTKIDALLTIKTKTAAHTLDADDLADVNLGKALNFIMDVAAGHDFTIPPNATQAFPIGTQLLVDYINTGATAFVAGSGVTIQSADGLTIAARYKGVVLKKIDTNTWLLQGALTT